MADEAEALHRDYRETVFLPRTNFPMRAGPQLPIDRHAIQGGIR